jgi:hypothetical protein
VAENLKRFNLAAMDLDGTLLGPDHTISEANALAVRRLQAAGAQVVLASGRHYDSMHKYVASLPGVQWVVSCQGGEVSDAGRTTILSRQFMRPAEVAELTEAGRKRGFSTVAYTVEGVFTDSSSAFEMDFYAELTGQRPVVLTRSELLARGIFKVIWMGEPADLLRVTPPQMQTVQAVRTNSRFLEFMPAAVSKGSALATLAAHLGIQPAAAVAFGDGENDIPMFAWAGMSVAMPHGWLLARARAKMFLREAPSSLNVRTDRFTALTGNPRLLFQPKEQMARLRVDDNEVVRAIVVDRFGRRYPVAVGETAVLLQIPAGRRIRP